MVALSRDANGQCTRTVDKFIVDINENAISYRAPVEIAKTLIHEILHAQLGHSMQSSWGSFNSMFGDYITVKRGKSYTDQHQLMIENYVEPMIGFLIDYDSQNGYTAPYDYYKAIALSGLELYVSQEEMNTLIAVQNFFRTRGLNCQ